MSDTKIDGKQLGKYLLWGIGLTAVALFLTFVLVIIMTAFTSSTNVPVLAMLSFIVVALGAILFAWYRHTQK
jgi:hypothetical protein